MEWWSIAGLAFGTGATVASFLVSFWGKWRTENNTSQDKLNTTNKALIDAQKERIDFLEESIDKTNNRLGELNKKYEDQEKAMRGLYDKNKELVALIALRDPDIQKLIKKSDGAIEIFLNGTAPKVDAIHSHIMSDKKVTVSVA